MMKASIRQRTYTSVFGANWVTGKYLLPHLTAEGKHQVTTVLDLGCGESPFKGLFPASSTYLRIDFRPMEKGVIQADMHALPCRDTSVDTVLLFQALADSPEPLLVLLEIERVLKPGGRLLIYESMDYPEHDLPHDYYRIMPAGIQYLSTRAGLHCTECIRLGGLFTRFATLWATFVMGRIQRHRIGRIPGAIGTCLGNCVCFWLDRLLPHPLLAANYLAIVEKPLQKSG